MFLLHLDSFFGDRMADVIYDPLSVGPLASAIKKLLVASFNMDPANTCCCILANTLRNHETMEKFLLCAGEEGLIVEEQFRFENGAFSFSNENMGSETLFPFTASVNCPTVFHKLILRVVPVHPEIGWFQSPFA
ncbi:unnamed protein product [Gongylonema pulchrum]|uniref:ANK_REP_REGION domain-containing protein n=1 Tax=Gongylonema pulchrum TaxID=637853 RepID=A0A183EBZ2_9BILA|nr:unnamed protein product [Gongylonema pulchrum]